MSGGSRAARPAHGWWPVAAWLAVVGYTTLSPEPLVPDPASASSVLRALIGGAEHAVLFGVLAFLVLRAMQAAASRALWAAGVLIALAALDEWAQVAIPNRNSSWTDWAGDVVGIVACTVVWLWRRRRFTSVAAAHAVAARGA